MDELISKQEALASIKNLYPDMPILDFFDARQKWLKKYAPYFECENAIEQLQPVKQYKQESKIGHWISHKEHCEINNLRPSGLGSYFWCSECDCGIDVKEWHRNNYNYCPNCGAKMESISIIKKENE